ncbi:MAG: phytoene desaturase family protein [Mycobacteriales bacterium]
MIVGGGHNGLVAACYLAKAGVEVLVLEQAGKPGGGSRTDETVPGHWFDTHSVAHNIINMTTIPAELDLAGAGLQYLEMEPFAAGFFTDGRVVRFHRSVDRTLASIAEHDRVEADYYESFIARALPLIDLAITGIQGSLQWTRSVRRLGAAVRAVRRSGGVSSLGRDLVTPYGSLLERSLRSDLTRAPVAAFAAHSSAGPQAGGSAFFALWQAAYHRFGQYHARGGAQALADALVHRLRSYGGTMRCGALVTRIDAAGGRVRAVELAGGERIAARAVITALDPVTALQNLLDPPLGGEAGRELTATHRGNAVQMLVHLAVDRLPAYPNARAGDWNGLQSHVDTLDSLRAGFLAAENRALPDPPPTYAFTTSALDPGLAPPGQHTVYLACPCAPYAVTGGWERHAETFAEAMIDQVVRHAPGFRDTITGLSIRTPAAMAEELRWPGAHPMGLDISLDQLAFLRPTRTLASHRTPVVGMYISGAGTAPVGGIAGTPGRQAALTLLADLHKRRSLEGPIG